MRVAIFPEPSEPEREAILAALVDSEDDRAEGWAEAALAENVEELDPEP